MNAHVSLAPAWFITGTDTEIGKTFVTCALLHHARCMGLRATGLKPVAAGVDANGQNEDVEAIRIASHPDTPSPVPPYLFEAPLAPHIAAERESRVIRFAPIQALLEQSRQHADSVIMEGVGGFRVPLGPDGDSADLVKFLGLPVILVVGMRLGCINHALLTVEAILSRGLTLAGWIANSPVSPMMALPDNLASLCQHIPAPLLGQIPYIASGDPEEASGAVRLPDISVP